MELWVRSQDKERLINVKNIELSHKYTEKETKEKYLLPSGNFEWRTVYKKDKYIKSIIFGNDYWLGEYQTKERALEILDEIQKLLQPQMILSKVGKPIAETCDGTVYVSPNEYEMKELSCVIYEMPKE